MPHEREEQDNSDESEEENQHSTSQLNKDSSNNVFSDPRYEQIFRTSNYKVFTFDFLFKKVLEFCEN